MLVMPTIYEAWKAGVTNYETLITFSHTNNSKSENHTKIPTQQLQYGKRKMLDFGTTKEATHMHVMHNLSHYLQSVNI